MGILSSIANYDTRRCLRARTLGSFPGLERPKKQTIERPPLSGALRVRRLMPDLPRIAYVTQCDLKEG